MKKLFTALLLLVTGSACQGTPATPPPTSTPVPPPTPTVAIQSKDLIEWADLRVGKGPGYSQSWSADGKWLATADYDQIRIWDASTFREAGALAGHTDFIWGLAWSPNGRLLASASQDGSVRLWDAESRAQVAALETGWAFCVAWSPDGKQLAVGNYSGEVQVWDASTHQLLPTWKSGANSPIISVAWSSDGQTLASGELGGDIQLWDVASGEKSRTLAGYTTARRDVNGLAWSPDGHILASAHQDGKVRLWEAETFELIRTIEAHTGWARGVAFSPNGILLASTGEDKRICLWDVATGQEYAEQHHNRLPVWSASWSPDSKYVASGGGGMSLEASNRLAHLVALLFVGRHYFIPVGGHSWLGCLGYVRAALEIHAQAEALGIGDARLVTAAGTGGTLAGLLAGLRLIGSSLRPLGIDVGKLWKGFPVALARLATEICRRLGKDRTFEVSDIPLIENVYAAPKYGQPSRACVDAIHTLARTEGILLDPVYTGKAFGGLLDLMERGSLGGRDEAVIFLHTGGLPALFAFEERILSHD